MSTVKEFPGFDKLFALVDTSSDWHFLARADFGAHHPFSVVTGVEHCDGITAKRKLGRRVPSKVVRPDLANVMFMHKDIVEALKELGCTGWSTYSVELSDGATKFPDYFGLVVSGRCGRIDHSRGEELEEKLAQVYIRIRGLFFDEDSWTGDDFFMPSDGTALVIVTERVMRVMKKLVSKELGFVPLIQHVHLRGDVEGN